MPRGIEGPRHGASTAGGSLSGYLMRTGVLNANLLELNEIYRLPYLNELIEVKQTGEQAPVGADLLPRLESEFARLDAELADAYQRSTLPESPSTETRKALNGLLVRIRLNGLTPV